MRDKVSRVEVIRLIAQARLAFGSEENNRAIIDDYDIESGEMETGLRQALLEAYKGVSNGYLSEAYEIITGKRAEVEGSSVELFYCPCCRRRTLTELYDAEEGTGYDICEYCGWEDDGTSDPSSRSSVNNGTIEDYRIRLQQEANYYDRRKWSVMKSE